MNNVISLNKSIEDKRFTNAKGLQQIFIGLGRSTVDDWARNGIITRYKIGGSVFYDLDEIKQLVGM
jgi:hypothetical protein